MEFPRIYAVMHKSHDIVAPGFEGKVGSRELAVIQGEWRAEDRYLA